MVTVMADEKISTIRRILGAKPVSILVDRSRDTSAGARLVHLKPDDLFRTTDSQVPLTAKRLAGYDVVAVCGNGRTAYGAAGRRVVRAFVRRGGGLLLAACTGAFEQKTGRKAKDSAVNSLARVFGFEFLSASKLPPDLHGCRGYNRSQLALTGAVRRIGLSLIDSPRPDRHASRSARTHAHQARRHRYYRNGTLRARKRDGVQRPGHVGRGR